MRGHPIFAGLSVICVAACGFEFVESADVRFPAQEDRADSSPLDFGSVDTSESPEDGSNRDTSMATDTGDAEFSIVVEPLSDGSFLCYPATGGLYAGILYNHGGTGASIRGDLQGTCRGFAEAGFVALAPLRPDQGTLQGQVAAVNAGLDALRMRDDVDPSRIGVMGFSHGGFLTVQAIIERPTDVTAAVICAPTPANGKLTEILREVAAVQASVSVLVAENDQVTNGGVDIDHVAVSQQVHQTLEDAGKESQLTIYPPFGDTGHELFIEVREPYWIETVRFFNTALVP
jgi:dienelactone hydrolase